MAKCENCGKEKSNLVYRWGQKLCKPCDKKKYPHYYTPRTPPLTKVG